MFILKTPDVIYSKDGKHIALKDNFENILVMPTRGNDFIKQMWLEKTAGKNLSNEKQEKLKQIYRGEMVDKTWIDLTCNENLCIHKNLFSWDKNGKIFIDDKELNYKNSGGGVIYIKNNKAHINTIRTSIGRRLWN